MKLDGFIILSNRLNLNTVWSEYITSLETQGIKLDLIGVCHSGLLSVDV